MKEMEKLLNKMKDSLEMLKDCINDENAFDCEMNIKMEKGTMKAETSGSSIGMLVCLKRTMKSLQEKFDISDEDLEELMENGISF